MLKKRRCDFQCENYCLKGIFTKYHTLKPESASRDTQRTSIRPIIFKRSANFDCHRFC